MEQLARERNSHAPLRQENAKLRILLSADADRHKKRVKRLKDIIVELQGGKFIGKSALIDERNATMLEEYKTTSDSMAAIGRRNGVKTGAHAVRCIQIAAMKAGITLSDIRPWEYK
jgi:hypothetical protein